MTTVADFWNALIGLIGSVLLFFFGFPSKLDPDGHINIIAEQIDEKEKNKAHIYKKFGYLGISFIGLSFFIQIIKIFRV